MSYSPPPKKKTAKAKVATEIMRVEGLNVEIL
jgi:hypothetical protein